MVYTVMPHDTVLSPSVFFRMCNIKKETYTCLGHVYLLIRIPYAPSHRVSHTGGCKVPNVMPLIDIWVRISQYMHLITSKLGVIVYSFFFSVSSNEL